MPRPPLRPSPGRSTARADLRRHLRPRVGVDRQPGQDQTAGSGGAEFEGAHPARVDEPPVAARGGAEAVRGEVVGPALERHLNVGHRDPVSLGELDGRARRIAVGRHEGEGLRVCVGEPPRQSPDEADRQPQLRHLGAEVAADEREHVGQRRAGVVERPVRLPRRDRIDGAGRHKRRQIVDREHGDEEPLVGRKGRCASGPELLDRGGQPDELVGLTGGAVADDGSRVDDGPRDASLRSQRLEDRVGFDLRRLVRAELAVGFGALGVGPRDGRRILSADAVAGDVDDALQLRQARGEVDQLLHDADVRIACLGGGHPESE